MNRPSNSTNEGTSRSHLQRLQPIHSVNPTLAFPTHATTSFASDEREPIHFRPFSDGLSLSFADLHDAGLNNRTSRRNPDHASGSMENNNLNVRERPLSMSSAYRLPTRSITPPLRRPPSPELLADLTFSNQVSALFAARAPSPPAEGRRRPLTLNSDGAGDSNRHIHRSDDLNSIAPFPHPSVWESNSPFSYEEFIRRREVRRLSRPRPQTPSTPDPPPRIPSPRFIPPLRTSLPYLTDDSEASRYSSGWDFREERPPPYSPVTNRTARTGLDDYGLLYPNAFPLSTSAALRRRTSALVSSRLTPSTSHTPRQPLSLNIPHPSRLDPSVSPTTPRNFNPFDATTSNNSRQPLSPDRISSSSGSIQEDLRPYEPPLASHFPYHIRRSTTNAPPQHRSMTGRTPDTQQTRIAPDHRNLDLSLYHEGPFLSSLARYVEAQERSESLHLRRGESTLSPHSRAPSIPPLQLEPDSFSELYQRPTSPVRSVRF
jgi:hypothetical protein